VLGYDRQKIKQVTHDYSQLDGGLPPPPPPPPPSSGPASAGAAGAAAASEVEDGVNTSANSAAVSDTAEVRLDVHKVHN